jgi:Integrase core domain
MVMNNGKFPHNLTVDGPGIEDKASPTLSPGSAGDLTVAKAPRRRRGGAPYVVGAHEPHIRTPATTFGNRFQHAIFGDLGAAGEVTRRARISVVLYDVGAGKRLEEIAQMHPYVLRPLTDAVELALTDYESLFSHPMVTDCGVDPETGELLPVVTIVTDNGGPFRSFRFEAFIALHPELAHVRTPERTPGQNGSRERGVGTLKYERLYIDEIDDAVMLAKHAEDYRIEYNTIRPRSPRLEPAARRPPRPGLSDRPHISNDLISANSLTRDTAGMYTDGVAGLPARGRVR